MRIGIVVWMLMKNKGGIERVGVELANSMRRRGHDVVIYYKNNQANSTPTYEVDENIELMGLSIKTTPQAKTEIRNKLVAGNLDVLVAMFSWKELLWFPASMIGLGIPLIISEHSHPEFINWIRWDRLEREAAMSGADRIHVLSETFVPMFPASMWDKMTIIPNAVQPFDENAEDRHTSKIKILMAAGRLEDELKQFSLLINAFSMLHDRYPEWRLHIFGTGKDRKKYEEMIKTNSMKNKIVLKGNTDSISEEYSRSHLFCTPSLYEGFSMVTAEAHSHGLPVVGFSECTGVNEVIIDGVNGLLAQSMNVDSLSHSLEMLMKDDAMREEMSINAIKTSNRYYPDKIYDAWEQLVLKAGELKNKTILAAEEFGDDNKNLYNLSQISRRRHIFKQSEAYKLKTTPYNENPPQSIYFVLETMRRESLKAKANQKSDFMETVLKQIKKTASDIL